ncbi:TIGR02444 family protein [Parvularcula sp. IMCC14364]|uniref:TIGR02444 family protein n=1 Tax=Parvularcula sp. IMCC14364 TaxID=3067902 RepID=UPI0027416CF4|nr:TIGR02444 family protein [Parvularcula sp. IMCC14364]
MTQDTATAPTQSPPEFWDWSLKTYDVSGLPEVLLNLQDEFDLDVNLILWCFWAGHWYPGLSEDQTTELLRSTQSWHCRVTVPLRKLRRDMKDMKDVLTRKACKGVRREVKNLELETERLEQEFLAAATRDAAEGAASDGADPAAAQRYFRLYRQLCLKLEPAGQLSVEGRMERASDLFAEAQQLINTENRNTDV